MVDIFQSLAFYTNYLKLDEISMDISFSSQKPIFIIVVIMLGSVQISPDARHEYLFVFNNNTN